MNDQQQSLDWDEILDNIKDKNLIPILGNEVYHFMDQGNLTGLDEYLSKKILDDNGLSDHAPVTMAEAVSLLATQKRKSPRDVNRILKEASENINFEFPPLKELLSIKPLNFFINTTVYNHILEDAFQKFRKQPANMINFSIRSRFSDCDNIENLAVPTVFNVFGSFKSADPAISDEEMLEFTTSFREKMVDNAPDILDALKNKALLFLGCTYPEWLIRFFIRTLSNERMNDWQNRVNHIIVVNDPAEKREKQFDFLKTYNADTYDGSTAEFIHELSERWNQQNPEKADSKIIFLSYTQKDKEAVENLKDALSQIDNVVCWYDKDQLHSGDNFEMGIIDNIMKAHLFIPLLSENSLMQTDKYVVDEWFKADTINKMKELSGSKQKYLMPIVIDNADLNHTLVKKFYPQLSIEPVPGGKPSAAFIERVKSTLNLS